MGLGMEKKGWWRNLGGGDRGGEVVEIMEGRSSIFSEVFRVRNMIVKRILQA